jgi:molybdopterin converting factor small subunit
MKIKVLAPGFIKHDAFDPNGFVELNENDSVRTLFNKLRIPLALRLILTSYVNYEPSRANTKLKEGDVVSFLFPITGG